MKLISNEISVIINLTYENNQILNSENNLSQTIVAERNSIEINHEPTQSIVPILVEKTLNKHDELDEILRRNENRSIRLTDSDVSSNKYNLPKQNFNSYFLG